jgi:hypothetical protein
MHDGFDKILPKQVKWLFWDKNELKTTLGYNARSAMSRFSLAGSS